MKKSVLVKRAGIVVGATLLFGFIGLRLADSKIPALSFLQRGEVVYTGKSATRFPGLKATETFMNIPMNWEKAVERVKNELPQAIQREDRQDGPYFIVPQVLDGRVKVTEFPEQSIAVKPGKLVRAGARLMVLVGSGEDWSHVEIQDFREPSALDSAFNWLNNKFGI